MHALFGYTVLRAKDVTENPYFIVRIEVLYREDPGKATQNVEIIARHESLNIARYWASQLIEGRETEESVKEKIAAGVV